MKDVGSSIGILFENNVPDGTSDGAQYFVDELPENTCKTTKIMYPIGHWTGHITFVDKLPENTCETIIYHCGGWTHRLGSDGWEVMVGKLLDPVFLKSWMTSFFL